MKASIILLLSICIDAHVYAQEAKQTGNHWLTMKSIATPEMRADKSVQTIPLNLYTKKLGFFCRQELHMQKAHVPVAFRLGSMNYCNWLEQKPGYR